jgi:hypothetical protein
MTADQIKALQPHKKVLDAFKGGSLTVCEDIVTIVDKSQQIRLFWKQEGLTDGGYDVSTLLAAMKAGMAYIGQHIDYVHTQPMPIPGNLIASFGLEDLKRAAVLETACDLKAERQPYRRVVRVEAYQFIATDAMVLVWRSHGVWFEQDKPFNLLPLAAKKLAAMSGIDTNFDFHEGDQAEKFIVLFGEYTLLYFVPAIQSGGKSYPDFKQVIPDYPESVFVKAKAITDALTAVKASRKKLNTGVMLALVDGTLHIGFYDTTDEGVEEAPLDKQEPLYKTSVPISYGSHSDRLNGLVSLTLLERILATTYIDKDGIVELAILDNPGKALRVGTGIIMPLCFKDLDRNVMVERLLK